MSFFFFLVNCYMGVVVLACECVKYMWVNTIAITNEHEERRGYGRRNFNARFN